MSKAEWGNYGECGQCPNCSAFGIFGVEDTLWIYPIASPNYPTTIDDYKDRSNWRCWSCLEPTDPKVTQGRGHTVT